MSDLQNTSRFQSTDLNKLKSNQTTQSTKSKEKNAYKLFLLFLNNQNPPITESNVQNLLPPDLDKFLEKFFAEVRTTREDFMKRNSIQSIRFALIGISRRR